MKKLNIALVAHDSRKKELMEWCRHNVEWLSNHNLYATGTTGRLIEEIEDFNGDLLDECLYVLEKPLSGKVTKLLSGPLGGDQQIGAMVAQGEIDVLIFFCDNLITQGHQQDVGALTRLVALYNIAFATNRTTADLIVTSSLITDENYVMEIPDVIDGYKNRNI